MRHRVKNHSFGRKPAARQALIRGLVDSLVEHGRIKTTLPKAKELRRHVEKAVTYGKEDTVHRRRVLSSKYPNQNTVSTVFGNISKRFKDRAGGYTRIIKLGSRPGDQADMAFIEFVDYELPEVTTAEADTPKAEKRAKLREVAKAKKSLRKTQDASRKKNR